MFRRDLALNKLLSHREKDIIKVVTGVRRCGKSTLLALYQQALLESGVKQEQIVSINLEDLEYEDLLDYRKLYAYLKERLLDGIYTYIFIDEVQQCQGFEKVVDSLHIKPFVDVYITGSNAHMFSGELATLLSGRYVTIELLPLSFNEYKTIRNDDLNTLSERFNDYIQLGSFPYIAQLDRQESIVRPYLEGIYSTILLKDVATREGIKDISLLESILKTMASGIGSPLSTKKIADTLISSGRKISVNTVDQYVRALTESFIFYRVDRYDIKGRQFLKTLGKYYIVDSGIRRMLLSQGSEDLGHIIENIVFLELIRRGYKVNIGKVGQQEIDFVVTTADGICYYQVAASVLDATTLSRELAPLKALEDNYPKMLLTLDDIGDGMDYQGIKQMNLLKWLISV